MNRPDRPDSPASDDLRDLLDSAAPDSPGTPPAVRVDAVRGRARVVTRRVRVGVAAAVLAVAGVGVGVPLALGDGPDGDGSPDVAASDPADPTPTAAPAVTPEPCPDPPVDVDTLAPVAGLPADAAWARVCAGAPVDAEPPGSSASAVAFDSTPVIEGAPALVEAIRALPEASPVDCATVRVAPTPWTLTIAAADGTTTTLGSPLVTCGSVEIEGLSRSAEMVLGLVDDAIAAEPEGTGVPDGAGVPVDPDITPVVEPACTDASEEPGGSDTYTGATPDIDAAAAVVCYAVDPMGGRQYAEDQGNPTTEQLAVLLADLRERFTAEPRNTQVCTDTGPRRVVVLADRQNRLLTLVDDRCSGEFEAADGHWQPGPDAERVLTEVLGGPAR